MSFSFVFTDFDSPERSKPRRGQAASPVIPDGETEEKKGRGETLILAGDGGLGVSPVASVSPDTAEATSRGGGEGEKERKRELVPC